jgi:cytochrome o ubiquinol oxidase subunit 2
MKFNAIATATPADFDKWVAQVRASAKPLDVDAYRQLAQPSENNAVAYFSAPTPRLFDAVMHKYMAGRTSLALSDEDLKLAALTKRLCAPLAVRSVN